MEISREERLRRLELAFKTLGWNGGTIHQVNKELGVKDIYGLTDSEFMSILREYSSIELLKRKR